MMRCDEVRDRLVAWQDAELSPGEATRVEEHLAGCADCRLRERRLAAATPRPELLRPRLDRRVPPDLLASLAERVSAEVVLAEARRVDPAPEVPPARAVGAWLRSEARVPMGWILVYAALLFGAIGFGLSGLWNPTAPPQPRVTRAADNPSGQFQPAAYDPAEGGALAEPAVPGDESAGVPGSPSREGGIQ